MIKEWIKSLVSEKKRLHFRFALYPLRALFYRGHHRYCPCCAQSFRRFLPKGQPLRPEAECPNCGALERTRLLWLFLQQEIKASETQAILHVAPERSIFNRLKKWPRYEDVDLNPANARQVMDITAIAKPDATYDLILCSHVLGHIPDEAAALRELKRVLKPMGMIIFMSLLDLQASQTKEELNIQKPEERKQFYGEPDLCRLHGLDLEKRISAIGLSVEMLDYRKAFSEEEKNSMQLGDGRRELFFIAKN